MFNKIKRDIAAILERDPAARNPIEVLLCYSGLHAIILYRLAHWFYSMNLKLVARLISNFARFLTLIEIHPAAEIDEGLFIDHGIGVVIGETTHIGKNVTIYQGQ
jgi:serine O-acetyltransferase